MSSQTYNIPGTYTFTTPVDSSYSFQAIGHGGKGQSNVDFGSTGGGGGYSASGPFVLAAGLDIVVTLPDPTAQGPTDAGSSTEAGAYISAAGGNAGGSFSGAGGVGNVSTGGAGAGGTGFGGGAGNSGGSGADGIDGGAPGSGTAPAGSGGSGGTTSGVEQAYGGGGGTNSPDRQPGGNPWLQITWLAVPVNTTPPQVTGTAQQAFTLTATDGEWAQTPTSYVHQWQRSADGSTNWTSISSATGTTYLLVAADVGKYVRDSVVATNADGSSTASPSDATGPIVVGVPVNSVAPVASGTTQSGATLSCSTGTWTNTPTSYSYQWQRSSTGVGSWVNLFGQSTATYLTTSGDIGNYFRCVVATSNAGGDSFGANSNVIGAITVARTPGMLTLRYQS